MGMSPREVDKLSLWEFAACADGYSKANGAEEVAEPPSYDEHLAMLAKLAPRP
jgi:hypothetical protein